MTNYETIRKCTFKDWIQTWYLDQVLTSSHLSKEIVLDLFKQ